MDYETIFRGTKRAPAFALVDENGVAVDMTSGTRSLSMRIMKHGNTSPDLTLSPTWTVQASGTGTFPITTAQTAALALGKYHIEVVYADSSTSEKYIVYRSSTWVVAEPYTGTI